MDHLRAMTVFAAVAEENGFAAASRRLNMSPPTVTRAINELETRLGARLLHRTTRTVSLTATGQQYHNDIKRILTDIEDADRHAAGLHAAPSGDVSVTGSALFGRMVVAPTLFEALDRFPDISLTTLFVDRVVHMVDEGIDIAVRIAELPDSSLSAVRVGSVRRVMCASPEYLGQSGRPEHPDDLAKHDLISFSGSAPIARWNLEYAGQAKSIKVFSRLRTNTADVAISAARAGRGITRVLSYMIADDIAAGRLVEVLPDFAPAAVPVHVVHRETGHVSARVRAIVDHLVSGLRAAPILDA